MENASRALTMSAEVMVGILVLAVGIYFLRSLSNFGNTTVFRPSEMERITEFNQPFNNLIDAVNQYKNQSLNAGSSTTQSANDKYNYHNAPTIEDVVTAMNYARSVNLEYRDQFEVKDQNAPVDDSYIKIYIQDNVVKNYLNKYYLDKPDLRSKFSDDMYKLIEKYAVKLEKEGSGQAPNLGRVVDVDIKDIKKDEEGRIREMSIYLMPANN